MGKKVHQSVDTDMRVYQGIKPDLEDVKSSINILTNTIVYATDPRWGAKGNDSTDDTVALQNFFNYLVANKVIGIIPKGTYKITSAINVPNGSSWGVMGSAKSGTTIKQYANNTPILNLGSVDSSDSHSVKITDIKFSFANPQTSQFPNGCALYINATYYESQFERLMLGGWFGIMVKASSVSFWGCKLDELWFTSECYGGAIDMSGSLNGIPNNHFGRIYVNCLNMTDKAMKLKGYNFVIDLIEFLNATNIPLMNFTNSSVCTIGAVKLEVGVYTQPTSLFQMSVGAKVKISQVYMYRMDINPTSGDFVFFNTMLGGDTGWLEIDIFEINPLTVSGNVYVLQGNNGSMRIKYLSTGSTNIYLTNIGSTQTCKTAIVDTWNNNNISDNKGDADYTVTLGDPTYINYETALTTSRTVNLPATNNNLFNGLRYRVRTYGAVNGTNTLIVKCNGVTKATLTTDKTVVEFMYRRNNTNPQNGWQVVGYQTLP